MVYAWLIRLVTTLENMGYEVTWSLDDSIPVALLGHQNALTVH